MHNYILAGNENRLYKEHNDLVDNKYDFELTGATLLGRDINAFTNPKTLTYITSLISEELENPKDSNFIKDMAKGDFHSFDYDENFNHCIQLIRNFLFGLQTKNPN